MTAGVGIPEAAFVVATVGTAVGLMARLLSGGDALRAHWPGSTDPHPPRVTVVDLAPHDSVPARSSHAERVPRLVSPFDARRQPSSPAAIGQESLCA